MSRIRSIHPGIWTDEDFVTLSAHARLLLIGIWNECDDKGIFEWKPLTLKMRLMPADMVDVADLLEEIAKAGAIKLQEVDGKRFGAVRNFCKFQRPKAANDLFPITAELAQFCGFAGESAHLIGEPLPNHFPNASEIGSQMERRGEEEGEKGKEEKAYAFCGRYVRLNTKDRAAWGRQFHAVPDLDAELATLDAWLGKQPEAKQKDWFITGASWLNRRHQAAMAQDKPRAEPAFSGPC